MSPLDAAIEDTQAAVDRYGQGTNDQPKVGSKQWYLLRSLTVSLAWLKRLQVLGLADDPEAAHLTYREALRQAKHVELDVDPEATAPGIRARPGTLL